MGNAYEMKLCNISLFLKKFVKFLFFSFSFLSFLPQRMGWLGIYVIFFTSSL